MMIMQHLAGICETAEMKLGRLGQDVELTVQGFRSQMT